MAHDRQADLPSPRITVLDPSRPELGDLAGLPPVREPRRQLPRPRPSLVLLVAQVLLVAAGLTAAGQLRGAPDLGLVSGIVIASSAPAAGSDTGTGSAEGLGSSAPAVVYTAVLAVAARSGRPFGLLRAGVPGYDVRALTSGTATRQFVSVVLRSGCAGVGRLVTPDRLDLTVRQGGRTFAQQALLDGAALLDPARRSCGYGSPQESLDTSVTSVRRVGASVVVAVVLRDGARQPTALLDAQVTGARVTTSPALPLALPPYSHDREGPAVAVTLTVSYDQCPTGAGGGGSGPVQLLLGEPGQPGVLAPLRAALVSFEVARLRKDLCGGG